MEIDKADLAKTTRDLKCSQMQQTCFDIMICRVYGINEKSQFQKASWCSYFFKFYFGWIVFEYRKNEVTFPTTKSIMIFNSAEHKPRKSGKIKFKVQELKSLDDCSALRDVSIMIKIDKVVLCFTKNRQLFKLF